MDKIRRISQELLDGEITGEEYYAQLMDTIGLLAETQEAETRMIEIANQLVK